MYGVCYDVKNSVTKGMLERHHDEGDGDSVLVWRNNRALYKEWP